MQNREQLFIYVSNNPKCALVAYFTCAIAIINWKSYIHSAKR